MTGDIFAPRAMGLHFIDDAPLLPFIDPTAAADRIGIQRHTLACYRNRSQGPRWFKIGKWVRYIPEDLDSWRRGCEPRSALDALSTEWHPDEARHLLVPMTIAARVLTITRHCMANQRREQSGPVWRRAGHRVYYALSDLLEWAAMQQQPVQAGSIVELRPEAASTISTDQKCSSAPRWATHFPTSSPGLSNSEGAFAGYDFEPIVPTEDAEVVSQHRASAQLSRSSRA